MNTEFPFEISNEYGLINGYWFVSSRKEEITAAIVNVRVKKGVDDSLAMKSLTLAVKDQVGSDAVLYVVIDNFSKVAYHKLKHLLGFNSISNDGIDIFYMNNQHLPSLVEG